MREKKQVECKVCGYKWTPRRTGKKPTLCANRECGSPNWETGVSAWDARSEQRRREENFHNTALVDEKFLEKMIVKVLEAKQPAEPETRDVPFVSSVSCGPPGGLTDDIGEVRSITIADPQAIQHMTPGAWVARADGDSMQDKTLPNSINDGDYLLMVPLAEWKRDVLPGMAILSHVYLRDGSEGRTLKEYQGKKLRARNPKFTGIDFSDGGDVVEAHAIAVCVYKLGQSFADKM